MTNTPEQLRSLATQVGDEAIKQLLIEAAEQHERMAAALMKVQVPDAHPEVVAAEPKPAAEWLALPWGGVIRTASVHYASWRDGKKDLDTVEVRFFEGDCSDQVHWPFKDLAAAGAALADIERQLGVTHDGYAPDDAAIEYAAEVGCPGCARLASMLRACGDSTRVVG